MRTHSRNPFRGDQSDIQSAGTIFPYFFLVNIIHELLEKVGLADRLEHYPRQLSGGEQQRVAIARAFASDPTVLFADEPTGNLDTQTGELICQLLFDLNKEFGTTLIMVTHDLKLAARCSRTIAISGGQILPSEQAEAAAR